MMRLNELIERIKRKGNLWEIFHKIVVIGLLVYIALALSWIDRGIEQTRSDVSNIDDVVSHIGSDISDIETNTRR